MFVPDPVVWVSDSQRPFVNDQPKGPDVIDMTEGKPLVFPCRVTSPNMSVSLVKVSMQPLLPIPLNGKQKALTEMYQQVLLFSAPQLAKMPH